jgi:hypothetical protein
MSSTTQKNTNKLWFEEPSILVNEWKHFFPTNNLSRNQKINAIARFGIYYAILILLFKQSSKWLSISIVLVTISCYLGYYESFENDLPIEKKEKCTPPTKNNPFMNFTLGDYISNPDRPNACPFDKVKDDIRNEFRKDIVPDPADLWGKNISDRQFFTMPWTTLTNDQSGFAKWLYGDSGECKNLGKNCDKNRDNRYHQSRYYIQY